LLGEGAVDLGGATAEEARVALGSALTGAEGNRERGGATRGAATAARYHSCKAHTRARASRPLSVCRSGLDSGGIDFLAEEPDGGDEARVGLWGLTDTGVACPSASGGGARRSWPAAIQIGFR
jgi:hypothetical protein